MRGTPWPSSRPASASGRSSPGAGAADGPGRSRAMGRRRRAAEPRPGQAAPPARHRGSPPGERTRHPIRDAALPGRRWSGLLSAAHPRGARARAPHGRYADRGTTCRRLRADLRTALAGPGDPRCRRSRRQPDARGTAGRRVPPAGRVHRRPWPVRLGRGLLAAARGQRMVPANVDALVGFLYRAGGRLFFTRPVAVLRGLVALAGLAVFGWTWWLGDQSVFLANGSYATGALVLLGLNVLALTCHEFGHALAAKHAGRRVPAAGFLVYFGIPSVFVDTTDVWMAIGYGVLRGLGSLWRRVRRWWGERRLAADLPRRLDALRSSALGRLPVSVLSGPAASAAWVRPRTGRTGRCRRSCSAFGVCCRGLRAGGTPARGSVGHRTAARRSVDCPMRTGWIWFLARPAVAGPRRGAGPPGRRRHGAPRVRCRRLTRWD